MPLQRGSGNVSVRFSELDRLGNDFRILVVSIIPVRIFVILAEVGLGKGIGGCDTSELALVEFDELIEVFARAVINEVGL